jgi:adenosylcobinamide-GDP ribazoletransferase
MSGSVVGWSAAIFPLVGALLGTLLGGIGLWLDQLLPAAPVAIVLLTCGVLLTGGLHLDGLMDTADGVFGGHSPTERLAIMRDSRVGAFGVMTGCLALLAQFACLSELAGQSRLGGLVAAATASRWTLLLALTTFPSARSSGLGTTFQQGAAPVVGMAGALLAGLISLACGALGVAALFIAMVVTLAGGSWLARRLGGLTGDAYGALAVVTETLVLFLAVAVATG